MQLFEISLSPYFSERSPTFSYTCIICSLVTAKDREHKYFHHLISVVLIFTCYGQYFSEDSCAVFPEKLEAA